MTSITSATHFIIFVLIIFTNTLVAQTKDYVAVWGEIGTWYGPEFILRYKVLDRETHMPVRDARITFEAGSHTLSLMTDNNGVGIIMVIRQDRFTTANVKIIAKNYKYWEQKVDYWNFKNESYGRRLVVNGMTMDWSGTGRPTMAETVNAVRFGNYQILRDRQIYFRAPGCFEFTVEMGIVERDVLEAPSLNTRHRYPETGSRRPQTNNRRSKLENRFTEDHYYDTEWRLRFLSSGDTKYIQFRPGKLMYKNDPYLEYNTGNINWWIEGQELIIDLGNYEKLVFDLNGDPRNNLNGINKRDNSRLILERSNQGGKNIHSSPKRSPSEMAERQRSAASQFELERQQKQRELEIRRQREAAELERKKKAEWIEREQHEEDVKTAKDNRSGIATRDYDKKKRDEVTEDMGMPMGIIGAVVSFVDPASAAYKAGLRNGMIVTSVKWRHSKGLSNVTPSSAKYFDEIMRNRKPGEKVELSVWHKSKGNNIKKGYSGSEQKGKWYQATLRFSIE